MTGFTARCISVRRLSPRTPDGSPAPTRSLGYTWAIAGNYGILGILGWFIDGLLLGTPFAIPLGAVDNIFHVALAVAAIAIIARAGSTRPHADAAAG